MLSSLPTELLSQIIEATVPHTFHSETHARRQSTLCALSLVSRQFRAIAQPLLARVVAIRSVEQFRALRAGQLGGAQQKAEICYVDFRDIRDSVDDHNREKTIDALARTISYATDVTLVDPWAFLSGWSFPSSLSSTSASFFNAFFGSRI